MAPRAGDATRVAGNAGGGLTLMRRYADASMDVAGACLVDVASECRTGRILTLDGEVPIFRGGPHRPFELLVGT